jgi:predicted dehydrogenase
MDNSIRLGIIGAGRITPHHLECARANGFVLSAICGRKNSVRALNLARKYEIPIVCDEVQEMIESDVDCYLITASTNAQAELLSALLPTKKFILVEKPVATHPDILESLISSSTSSRVVVGFNRRYYSSVRGLKEMIDAKTPLSFILNVPESSWNSRPSSEEIDYLILENTVHMFDLVFHLFGRPREADFFGINDSNGLFQRTIVLKYSSDDLLGTIYLTMGSPDNTSLTVSTSGRRVQLLPIENLKVFDSIEMSETLPLSPNKKYTPVSSIKWESSIVDVKFKAGFYEQMREFKEFINTEVRSSRQASLDDAKYVLEFASRLLNL